MAKKKTSTEGLTVKKSENFSEWYSQVIEKAEIVDLRLGIKGFIVVRPWGTLAMEKMYDFFEEELQAKGHMPTIMPSVIPESNLKQESSHIQGFTPEVFWLNLGKSEKKEDRLALRPTSETLFTPMFKLWVRSWRDLPMKLYQRGSVFRFDTKATRPLIRGREFWWIECHDAFATKAEAEEQMQEDISTTEKVMHQDFCVPFLAMRRPSWDKFAGAEYTIGSDVLMPDGKMIQQPSTHLLGQKFSKAFNATFKDKDEKDEFLWTTAYGPAISRILVSVISTHGDDRGLVLPFSIAPFQAVIIPIYNKSNKSKVMKYALKIRDKLKAYRVYVDNRENQSVGWKFNEWELKGVPFRIEIGEKEAKIKKATLSTRDTGKKELISLNEISKLESIGKKYDERLRAKANEMFTGKIIECKSKQDIKKALDSGKIAKVAWCSTEENGLSCAEKVEKDFGAEVRGTRADKKESPGKNSKCIICGKPTSKIVYIARSY